MLLGVVLFGAGFGNATSLPPLIAQVEFVKEDVARVVGLIVGISQGGYAFAPALFGLIRELAPHAAGAAPHLFLAAALVQGLAHRRLPGRPPPMLRANVTALAVGVRLGPDATYPAVELLNVGWPSSRDAPPSPFTTKASPSS